MQQDKMYIKDYFLKNKWLIFVKKTKIDRLFFILFYLFNSKKNIIFALLKINNKKKNKLNKL